MDNRQMPDTPWHIGADSNISVPNLNIIMGSEEGNPFIYDLGKMPHLFISGTTGTGKTSYVENLISELMAQNSPEDIQFLIYTSKENEYIQFNGSPFMLENTLSEQKNAKEGLQTIVDLIEHRFSKAVVHKAGLLDSDVFVVIDDASFITNHDWANSLLSKIIQDGRIAKIHLILVTSNPYGSNIPPRIRDGIPCRIAFQTTTAAASRIIIGRAGAEELKAPGELIFKSYGRSIKLKSTNFSFEGMWEPQQRAEEDKKHWLIQTKNTYEKLKRQRQLEDVYSPSSMSQNRNSRNNLQTSSSILHRGGKRDGKINVPPINNYNAGASSYASAQMSPRNRKEAGNEQKQVLLTPQESIKGSTIRVKVVNNSIVIQKKLKSGVKAKMHINIGVIRCFRHHKPSFFRKGYIGIELNQKFSFGFSYDNTYELRYKTEVKRAFSKELNSHFIKIEYADHKDKRFKEFIELLTKDSGISLYEE